MKNLCLSILLLVLTLPARPAGVVGEMPLVTLDDQIWVLFYDLPSRRFRAIRDAFIRGELETARQDLTASEGFLRVEISRADPALAPPMIELADRLKSIAENIGSVELTVGDLDSVFARGHWLLAQHYLTLATSARDAGQHVSAGHYLFATAHHLERTVLWSDARINRKVGNSLDDMREMADELRTSKQPERVYRSKPIDNARRTLVELGQYLERKVWIDPVPK